MTQVLVFLNVLIFSAISLLHLYWVFGGRWASEQVIPDHLQKKAWELGPTMKIATLLVALGLAAFALVMLANLYPILPISATYITYATLAIGSIFLIRAIGDFQYVGFFKQVKNTRFGHADSRIFSPLCLLIASICFVIAFF